MEPEGSLRTSRASPGLAKVHLHLDQAKAWDGNGDYGLVLIGAALWAATPSASPPDATG
jgi:hypothetical protein